MLKSTSVFPLYMNVSATVTAPFWTALIPDVNLTFIFSIDFPYSCYIKSFKPGTKPIVRLVSRIHKPFVLDENFLENE